MALDATAERPVLKSADDSETVIKVLLDQHADGIAIVVDDANVYVNPAMRRMFGYTTAELLDTGPLSLIAPHDQDRALARLRAGLEAEHSVPTEYDCVRRDGTIFPVEALSSRRITYEGRPAFLSTIRDQTERKRTQQALLEAETKYRCLVENSLVGVYLIQNGTFAYVNPTLTQMLGYTQEEMVGVADLGSLAVKEDLATIRDRMAQQLTGKAESTRDTFRARRKDGQIAYLEVHGGRTTYNGQPAIIGMCLDVTERRRLQEQLEQSIRVESVGQLAAGVAHNFNNALMVISGYSELVADRLSADDPSRGDLEQIQHVTERSASLTQQLLAFSRKESIERSVFCLNDAIKKTSDLLTSLLGDGFTLGTELGSIRISQPMFVDAMP